MRDCHMLFIMVCSVRSGGRGGCAKILRIRYALIRVVCNIEVFASTE